MAERQGPEISARIKATGEQDVKDSLKRVGEEAKRSFEDANSQSRKSSDASSRAAEMAKGSVQALTGTAAAGAAAIGTSVGGIAVISEGVVAVIGRIAAAVGMAGGSVDKGLGQASSGMGEFVAANNQVGSVTDTLGGAIGRIATAIGIAGGAIGVGISGAKTAVDGFVAKNNDAISSLRALSDATGLSVESLSTWQAAVRLQGGKTEDFDSGIKKLHDLFFQVAEKGDQAAIPFMRLGVSARDQTGAMRSFTDVANEVIEAISKIPDATHRARAAVEMFGESGSKILDVIDVGEDGKVGLNKNIAEAKKKGLTYTDKSLKEAEDRQNDRTETDEGMRRFWAQMSSAVSPLVGGEGSIEKGLVKNSDKISGWVKDKVDAFTDLKSDIEKIWNADAGTEVSYAEKKKKEADAAKKVVVETDPDKFSKSSGDIVIGTGAKMPKGVVVETDPNKFSGGSAYRTVKMPNGAVISVGDPNAKDEPKHVVQQQKPVVSSKSEEDAEDEEDGDEEDTPNPVVTEVAPVSEQVQEQAPEQAPEVKKLEVTHSWLAQIAPAIMTAKAAWTDLNKAMSGEAELGSVVPWMAGLKPVVEEAKGLISDLGAIFSSFFDSIKIKLPEGGQGLKILAGAIHVVRDAVAAFKAAVSGDAMPEANVFSGLNPHIQRLHDWLGWLKTKIADVTGIHSWSDFGAAIEKAFKRAKDAVSTFVAMLTGDMLPEDNIFSGLNPHIQKLHEWLGWLKTKIADATGIHSWEDFGKAVETNLGRAKNGVIWLKDKLKELYDFAMPWLKRIAKALGLVDENGEGDAGKLILLLMIVYFTGLVGKIKEAITEFFGLGTSISGVIGWLQLLLFAAMAVTIYVAKTLMSTWMDVLSAIGNKSYESAGVIWAAMGTAADWVARAWDKAGTAIKSSWETIGDDSKGAKDRVKRDWSDLGDVLFEPFKALGEWFDKLIERVTKKIDEFKKWWNGKSLQEQAVDEVYRKTEEPKGDKYGPYLPPMYGPEKPNAAQLAASRVASVNDGGFSDIWGGRRSSVTDILGGSFDDAVRSRMPAVQMPQQQPPQAPALAPVTINIGGQDIGGFLAPQSAIDAFNALARQDALSQRAPDSRGSGG